MHINNPKARKGVLNFIEEENVIDVWRIMNEESKVYTWRRLNPTKKQARLGFYLISDTISKKISNDQELIQSDPISCPQNQKGNN